MPIAAPRSFGGKTEEIMAIFVQKIIALPMPCNDLKTIKITLLEAKPQQNVVMAKMPSPTMKTVRLPQISASRPKGT